MGAKPSFQRKEMRIRTIGDLKELLKDMPDELVIGYVDFSGDETVVIWQQRNKNIDGQEYQQVNIG
jgi:hypothetical protein